MIRWFRRKRPAPPPATLLSVSEALIVSAWGLTEHEWLHMEPRTRAWHRENVTKAGAYASTYSQ